MPLYNFNRIAPVPAAKDFIDKVRDAGIQLIFLSNRMDERLQATKNNMKKCNIYSKDDIYLLRLDKADKKHVRRNEVYNAIGRMKNYDKFEVRNKKDRSIAEKTIKTIKI